MDNIKTFWQNFSKRKKNSLVNFYEELKFENLKDLHKALKYLKHNKNINNSQAYIAKQIRHEKSHAKVFKKYNITPEFYLVIKYIDQVTYWAIKTSIRIDRDYPNLYKINAEALIQPLKDGSFLSKEDVKALVKFKDYLNDSDRLLFEGYETSDE